MNLYDSVAMTTGVDRESVKKVLLAAGFTPAGQPINSLVNSMAQQVHRFQVEILNLPIPAVPTLLSAQRQQDSIKHLQEELDEISEAFLEGDLVKANDGLLDLCYVALGRIIEQGCTPASGFDEVHEKNMLKVPGVKPNRPNHTVGFDAIKPEGWEAPTLELMCKTRLEDLQVYWGMSHVLREVGKLRVQKGNDYNSGVKLTDYFPFGHESYAHIVFQKALRGVSLVKLLRAGGKPNFEGLRDTMVDLINYASFYVEWMDAERDKKEQEGIA